MQLLFVEFQEVREVAAGRAGGCKLFGRDALEPKFGDGFGEGAGKPGSLRDRCKVVEAFRAVSGMCDAGGESVDAQSADRSKRVLTHKWRGEVGSELCQRERVDALATLGETQER